MCLYTTYIKNRKYTENKKNGGQIPPVPDIRVLYVPIGCQNCIECRKQKSRAWAVRLHEDIKDNRNGKFITLTFSNESIQKLCKHEDLKNLKGYKLDNAIAKKATRLFLERWRKKYKKSLRHWLVTELGHNGTENIHMHGIIWTDKSYKEIEEFWQYGYIWPTEKFRKKTYVNEKTINYIVKYVNKMDFKHPHYKPIILTSPGIGKNYTEKVDYKSNKYQGKNTKEYYTTRKGLRLNLPVYYRNKIYSDQEREQLWLFRLDKNKRYICGDEIEANSRDLRDLLRWHRKRNIELGYGTHKKDWNEEENENIRRQLTINRRLENTFINEWGYPKEWDN